MNTGELTNLLAQKFKNDDAVMFLTEVANSTGANAKRFADAVTVSLWPSRGYCVEGYEIKVSKSDLEHELQDVTKWEAVGQFCDRWWLVVSDKKIVDLQRLPVVWGVMYPTKTGKLRVLKPASKLTTKPFSKGFMASLLRKASDHSKVRMKLREEYSRGRRDGIEAAKGLAFSNCGCERLRKNVEDFEKASGIEIGNYGGERLGDDFREFQKRKLNLKNLQNSTIHLERTLNNMTAKLQEIKESLKEESANFADK